MADERAAAPRTDSTLIELGSLLRRVVVMEDAVYIALDHAEHAASAAGLRAEPPHVFVGSAEGASTVRELDAIAERYPDGMLPTLYPTDSPVPVAKLRAKLMRDTVSWWEACQRFDLGRLREIRDALNSMREGIYASIRTTPAQTITGLAVKAQVVRVEADEGGMHDHDRIRSLFDNLADDIQRLAAA